MIGNGLTITTLPISCCLAIQGCLTQQPNGNALVYNKAFERQPVSIKAENKTKSKWVVDKQFRIACSEDVALLRSPPDFDPNLPKRYIVVGGSSCKQPLFKRSHAYRTYPAFRTTVT